MATEQKHFDNNYCAVLTLIVSPVGYVRVIGADTMEQYLEYFFHNFPIAGWNFYKDTNKLSIWGNRWPVETVIELLSNVTLNVERLS